MGNIVYGGRKKAIELPDMASEMRQQIRVIYKRAMRAQKLEDDHRIKARQYSIEGNESYANKHRAEA